MQKVTSISELRCVIKNWRDQGLTIAFVPTMGNLHKGHIKLVAEAHQKANKVVVSIFVNPTQFGPGEDFDSYPRTEAEDEAKLVVVATDLLFSPKVKEIYPEKLAKKTIVSVVDLSKRHCGASRPGHFNGVATIVTKLLNMVQPDSVFFGEKDFQQLALVRNLVQDLNIPVEVFGVLTEREDDGLAMSSRNGFLTEQERQLAPELFKALCKAKKAVLSGEHLLSEIELEQRDYLDTLGFKVDYFSICNSTDLQEATDSDKELVILAAAKLGKPRLIDNIYFSRAKTLGFLGYKYS